MGNGTLGTWLYQAWGVPWLKDDPNLRLKNLTAADYRALVARYEKEKGDIKTEAEGYQKGHAFGYTEGYAAGASSASGNG